VLVPRFFELFLNYFYFIFLNFFNKIKKIATCQAVIVPRGSDVTMTMTRQYYTRCHSLSLNLVPLL